MSALTAGRNTPELGGAKVRDVPVAAGACIFAGSLVAQNAAGFAVPMTGVAGLTVLGRAEDTIDNAAGADGDQTIRVKRGVFRYANAAGADEITAADRTQPIYAADDQTVAKTDGGGTRSRAGTVYDVDARGVWVEI